MATQLNNWLSIDKASGTGNAQITLTASSYTELVDRATSIKIQAQSTNAILNVRQNGVIPKTEEELKQQYFWVEFEETGGTITFEPNWIYGAESFKAGKYSDIAYSFDGINWARGITIKMNDKTIVYLENKSGNLNNADLPPLGNYEWETINFDKRARVGGVIGTLSSFRKGCFYRLFEGNSYLTDASKLILPWKTLDEFCYEGMFNGCSSLTKAPKLPATTLAYGCYQYMFDGCTSLTNAPALPATTLAEKCYDDMFAGCISITNAPALPATTLANYCYSFMFNGCSSLTKAPELPATTLEGACYYGMFYKCTSLTKAPVLPAKKLTYYHTGPSYFGCYDSMFYGCTNLNYIKMLSEDNVDWHYTQNWVRDVAPTGTFNKSKNATIEIGSVDGIPIGWTVYNEGDPNIPNPDAPNTEGDPNIPNPDAPNTEGLKQQYFWVEFEEIGGTISGLTNQYTDMYHSFNGSTWETTPNTLSMGSNRLVYFKNETKKITNDSENLYLTILFNSRAKVGGDISSITDMVDYACKKLFYNNEYLTDASELILPWDTLANECYYGMFEGCTSLTTVPQLPAITLVSYCYTNMFKNCTGLTTVPQLPATTLDICCYYGMFEGCTSLTTVPQLPATTLAKNCYTNMFKNCTSLTTAPELPATTLVSYCYSNMFEGCTKLNYIKMLGTDFNSQYVTFAISLYKWVINVAPTGTFVKHPNANIPTGTSGIPDGWTVETATE